MERLVGLPEGWGTDPHNDLADAQQLTRLGNGVIPTQATAALRTLIWARTDQF